MDDWSELEGWARIYPPTPKSVPYVVKYVVKNQAWEPFGTWARRKGRWERRVKPPPAGLLLPPENVTRWLGVDVRDRRIEIDPSAAIPDPT